MHPSECKERIFVPGKCSKCTYLMSLPSISNKEVDLEASGLTPGTRLTFTKAFGESMTSCLTSVDLPTPCSFCLEQ